MRQKKLWGIIVSAALVLGSTLSAAAANTKAHTITIENSRDGHVYEAYQVFSGEWSREGTGESAVNFLSNVDWGSGTDGPALLAELKGDGILGEFFAEADSAAACAEVLEELGKTASGDQLLDRFAELAWKHHGEKAGESTETESPYTIDVSGDGYYLVKDKDPASGTYPEGDAATRYMLQVVGDITVTAKADAPTLEKKILEGSSGGADRAVDANEAGIGDTVRYQLKSAVPQMDGYEKYFFIVHDTLSEGLDFLPESPVVTVGGRPVPASDIEVVTPGLESGCTFEIVFKDFLNKYKEDKGEEIVITYSAVLNEHAKVGTLGNENEACLEYSNNPNITPKGTDRPSEEDGNVTGKTPEDLVLTYVSGIKLTKVDAADTSRKLTGAQFTLTGTSLNKVIISTSFEEKADGTWYKLKDGTYTEEAPGNGKTEDLYESTSVKYGKAVTALRDTGTVTATGIVDENGVLEFRGLGAGTYEIREILAPTGYNLLKDPITVTLAAQIPEEVTAVTEAAAWKYTLEEGKTEEEILENGIPAEQGIAALEAKNERGAVLPSSGGTGTALIYIGGAILVMAGTLLFFRGRKEREA